jgi:Ribonucleotide reductase, alpha subunit
MLTMLFETGHPWITFKDACNVRSPQQHVGVVHSSNLCTEITLNTGPSEIAVCNLGSVNLVAHLQQQADGSYALDHDKLRRTVSVAMRMLDNVIDINYYAVAKARNSNLKHRPVGLGIMGFQDCLHQARIPYGSQEAVELPTARWKPCATRPTGHPPNWHKSAGATAAIPARCGTRASCRTTPSNCWPNSAAAMSRSTHPRV